jgi:outer membrane lipoprotein-sorting protein
LLLGAAPLRADSIEVFEPAPGGVDARAVAVRAANSMRSDRTYIEAAMTIRSSGHSRPRMITFQSWDDRVENRSFIRILTPGKDAGTAFLKLQPNLWSYLSREERKLRITSSMMLQPWMGSGFTYDDLFNPTSAIENYHHTLLGVDPNSNDTHGLRAYVVEYLPRETASIVWGRILGWVEIEHGTPLRQEFYDESGEKLRTILFSDIREIDERRIPHVWDATAHDRKNRRSTIEFLEIRFDEHFDDDLFSTRNLKVGNRGADAGDSR